MSLSPTPPPEPPPDGSSSVNERQTVSNRYGTVTNLAVYYNVKKNIFAHAEREDLVMRHVVAARLEMTQRTSLGLLLALAGIICLHSTVILAIILLIVGIFLILRKPLVLVTAADGVIRPSVGWPWTRSEAEEFVNGVRKELLARG
jgi:hypothetical protein